MLLTAEHDKRKTGKMAEQTKEMEAYFKAIEHNTLRAYKLASAARKKGLDPEDSVDIKLAKNMAERVEGLISSIAPQLIGKGLPERILELEKEYSALDWRVALVIAKEVAEEKFCKFKDKKEAMEVGIKTGFAYQTGGIVAAPLEGFIELKIKKTRNNTEYLAPCYAGPVRGAGGTAAAFSLLIVDFVRKHMGYDVYDPDENEINRYKTEINDYHERVTNLQYHPSDEEIEFLIRHIPIEIDGDPTEKFEVSNYKDLARIETNRIRGGICLVLAEGLAQKAPKLWKRLSKWGHDFNLGQWDFLADFLTLQKKIKAKSKEKKADSKISPNYTFIADLVAGRPVLTYPMAVGGFRLRYGRSRVSGFSAASINPATLYLLNNYIATGTQLKVERPGKGAAITPCDTIYGPIIKLSNGSVVKVNTISEAKQYTKQLKEILFLGDILFNYGDFSENNHVLVPSGFTEEEWLLYFKKSMAELFENSTEKLSSALGFSEENINAILTNIHSLKLSFSAASKISRVMKIPLHPQHLFYWSLITAEDLAVLLEWLSEARFVYNNEQLAKIILNFNTEKDRKNKKILESLGMVHDVITNEFIVIEKDTAQSLFSSLGIKSKDNIVDVLPKIDKQKSTLEIINSLSDIKIMDLAGTFIGARMGRPEKAKMRKMTGSPHVLFPVAEEGGRLRSFQSAIEEGQIEAEFPVYFCEKCNKPTIYRVCETCGKRTKRRYYCSICNAFYDEKCTKKEPKDHSSFSFPFKRQKINIQHYFSTALKQLKMHSYPDLIKGVRGTSNKDHTPENLAKGILRAKYEIYVNKDGTTRYDMTELPMTHFKPIEIGTPIEKLKELGYTHDIYGKKLESESQILELKPQDVVLAGFDSSTEQPADEVLFNISKFIDDLLVNFYGEKPFYNLKSKQDLIGHLIIGLAPHTSAGTVGRIIGFTKTQAFFAHPIFHAAMRRDCDGDEACAILLMDAFLNFSHSYLPDSRGSRTMDAPLVLTYKVVPAEVDDMVHGLDTAFVYPLEFYEAARNYKQPYEVKIPQLKDYLGTEKQYQEIGFTHDTSNINNSVNYSAYKELPSMEEKLNGQMEIAEKIRAVDESDVARLVIEKHFLKDTKGNLRKFSTQEVRCVKCNTKFRRPPLSGKCTNCGGKIIFTVSEGSVIKYLHLSTNLGNKYNVPNYLKQTLLLLNQNVESVFGKEKEKQEALNAFFS